MEVTSCEFVEENSLRNIRSHAKLFFGHERFLSTSGLKLKFLRAFSLTTGSVSETFHASPCELAFHLASLLFR